MTDAVVCSVARRIASAVCLVAGMSAWAAVAAGDEGIDGVPIRAPETSEEQRLIAVLDEPDTVSGKEEACEELRRVGTVASIPALAKHLGDESLSHPARLALESMPFPEAGAALREALRTASDAARVGIVESLGTRGEPESTPLLAPLVRDTDPVVASAAALALGKIGGSGAVEALQAARAERNEAVLPAIRDGLLQCAEGLRVENPQAAHALYADMFQGAALDYVRTAAYHGMIATAGSEATALVTSALMEEDPALWAAALPAIRESQKAEGTRAYAALVARAPRTVLPGLIEALAQRGDPAATLAVASAAADADPAVRAAAIRALGLIGNASAVPVLVRAAAHGEEADREAAEKALARLGSEAVLSAMLKVLDTADGAETIVLARALGQRDAKTVRPVLIRLAKSQQGDVRTASVLALGQVATTGDVSLLCKLALESETATARSAAERALVSMGKRLRTPPMFVDGVLSGLSSNDTQLRCSMLRVCGALSHPRLVEALAGALDDPNTEVRDAAIRALAGSPDPRATALLLSPLETAPNLTQRVLMFRGIARLASDAEATEVAVREDTVRRALAVAERPEEKKLLLAALSSCHTIGALDCAEAFLAVDEVAAEAVLAWTQIANALPPANAARIRASVPAVLDRMRDVEMPDAAQQTLLEIARVTGAMGIPGDRVRFERVVIDARFRSEGVAVADVNRDGASDILVGDVWYAAPDWTIHEIRPPKTYDPESGYSECFATFAFDVDQDGWVDSIVIGFPAKPALWYRNPGNTTQHWEEYTLASSAAAETPLFDDLLGDGTPVPVFALDSRITWFRPGADYTRPWQAFPISRQLPAFKQYGHGLGMGDVNGDGRNDLLITEGWWEAPEDRTRSDWTFHKAPFGPACADMIVHDVDGDGDNDILTSSAHEYGLWWFEHVRKEGVSTFRQHELHNSFSQSHAMVMADINGDGSQDLITGKRYRAHNGNDPGSAEPATLCWIELNVSEKGVCEARVHEIDNDSGIGTQFRVADLDGDGLLDVVTSNKKGVHAFLQRRTK